MRQILYVSLSTEPGGADLAGILAQSRHNNAIDGITGLLWSDGRRFLQALEGPRDSIAPCFARIQADPRHHAIRVLSDRLITTREFGTWNMMHREARDAAHTYDMYIQRFLSNASPDIRAQVSDLLADGVAAGR